MTDLQTTWTEHELLETHPIEEPLWAGGVKCHGGFDADGQYVSPRTLNRFPAIRNWQEQRKAQFGTDILDIELSSWPEHYPSVDQSRYLISEGVTAPFVSILTRIGTVEGFGSMIRYSVMPDMQACFDEEITGTAMSHLDGGLYEAHARDEAGFGDEGGHKQMWFAARDIAFDNPVTKDETEFMLARMGIGAKPGAPDVSGARKQMLGERTFDDIDVNLEMLIARMASLLLIEISAYHTFAWAEEVLSDTALVSGEGEAARLVSYIRSDEAPHVEYLKTTLSEMRDRTFVGESGKKHPGTKIVGQLWDQAKANSFGARRDQMLAQTLGEITYALEGNARKDEILERFHSLGTVRPKADGTWETAEPLAY
ncbi:MAG: uncharacterized protein QOG03_2358 [Actinomycetota bacterium]|jgi:hypothetical protein|nr:uncharacterized protein [Actinomycetota bacterium]